MSKPAEDGIILPSLKAVYVCMTVRVHVCACMCMWVRMYGSVHDRAGVCMHMHACSMCACGGGLCMCVLLYNLSSFLIPNFILESLWISHPRFHTRSQKILSSLKTQASLFRDSKKMKIFLKGEKMRKVIMVCRVCRDIPLILHFILHDSYFKNSGTDFSSTAFRLIRKPRKKSQKKKKKPFHSLEKSSKHSVPLISIKCT